MLNKIYITYFVALALGMSSCGQSEETPAAASASSIISFGVTVGKDNRAATLVGSSNPDDFRAQSFSVYGDHIFRDARSKVFEDVPVTYDGKVEPSPSGWNYKDKKNWEANGNYEFRAYWPASNPKESTSNTQTLALRYNMLEQNEDLMVAYRGCPTKSNPVRLNFHHVLAAVSVKFMTTTTAYEFTIKNYFFTSLYYIGTLAYDSKEDDPNLTDIWHYAERSQVNLADVTKSMRIREWKNEDGRLIPSSSDDYPEEFDFFLPQSLQVPAGVARPSLTFVMDIKQGDKTDTATVTVALPDTDNEGNPKVWEAGKKYVYVVRIKPDAFDITVNTTQWDEVNVSVGDIEF